MENISNFIKGVFIGSGAILPGISSGVICMVVGLYEKLLDSILNFFKDIKNNLKFLLPIVCGGIVGIILFSNIISYCFNIIPCQTKSLFIGLLLRSIYILAQENLKEDNSLNIPRYIALFACFFIGIALIGLEGCIDFSDEYTPNQFKASYLVLSGFFMSIGIVVPGVSSTVILMLLGVYSTYLSAVSVVNMNFLFPLLLGVRNWIYCFYENNKMVVRKILF